MRNRLFDVFAAKASGLAPSMFEAKSGEVALEIDAEQVASSR